MQRVDGLDSLPRALSWPVVSVGTFDGVHLGHRAVIGEVVRWAREKSGAAVAVTFEEPPKSTLTGEHPLLVTSLPHRLSLLASLSVDLVVVLDFTKELASLSAEEFVRRALLDGLGAKGIVLGHGSAFGRGREGNERFLRARQAEFGLEVRGVDAAMVDGRPVSSTRVRKAVLAGDLATAEKLLGRPFSVYGTVVRGDGRGRQLGFPTANLDLHHEITPPDGVYAAQAETAGGTHPALVSIGSQPTFAHERDGEPKRPVVEVYLIGFEGSLYGLDLEARFLKRLRAQERFADVEALTRRMHADLAAARDFLSRR